MPREFLMIFTMNVSRSSSFQFVTIQTLCDASREKDETMCMYRAKGIKCHPCNVQFHMIDDSDVIRLSYCF